MEQETECWRLASYIYALRMYLASLSACTCTCMCVCVCVCVHIICVVWCGLCFCWYILEASMFSVEWSNSHSLIRQLSPLTDWTVNRQRCNEIIEIYCMKPPNIKAPKCTLFSIQCFIFQGQRSQGLTGLAMAPCEHRGGQLTSESPFRIFESG